MMHRTGYPKFWFDCDFNIDVKISQIINAKTVTYKFDISNHQTIFQAGWSLMFLYYRNMAQIQHIWLE